MERWGKENNDKGRKEKERDRCKKWQNIDREIKKEREIKSSV
jgi:hypothetical protein